MDNLIGSIPYIGEITAFLAAIFWAFAVILFRKSGESVHPVGLNIFKNVFAAILFLPSMYLFGETLFYGAPFNDYLLLIVSGIIGVAVGDSLFFKSLNILGAGFIAIISCLYSPIITVLSIVFLKEGVTLLQLLGVALVVIAVLVATFDKGGAKLTRRDLIVGVVYGALAVLAMGIGVIVMKDVVERSPVFWATEIRLLGGVFGLAIMLLFYPKRREIIKSIFTKQSWGYMVGGTFSGTYLAMILWVMGNKYALATVASALNQTTNIFTFVFAVFMLSEKVTVRKIIGILLAIGGAVLVSFCGSGPVH